ncbi:MAG: hypothetical protein KDJ88_02510 [Bauldia sp.]|nr:hypothetical protein [Bauldia sp.]
MILMVFEMRSRGFGRGSVSERTTVAFASVFDQALASGVVDEMLTQTTPSSHNSDCSLAF